VFAKKGVLLGRGALDTASAQDASCSVFDHGT
jgi:hypothetical protein